MHDLNYLYYAARQWGEGVGERIAANLPEWLVRLFARGK